MLNVHFHSLVLDGVYVGGGAKEPRFVPLPPPDDADVARVAATVDRKIARLLASRGLTNDADPDDADPLSRDQPLLAGLYSASIRGRIATGPHIGRRVARLGDRIDPEDIATATGPRCAAIAGLSVHANVAVPARDRKRLERLCRLCGPPHKRHHADRGVMRTS